MKRFIIIILMFVMSMTGCQQEQEIPSVSADEISREGLHIYSSEEIFEGFQYIYLAEPYKDGFYAYASMKEEPLTPNLYYCDLKKENINKLNYDANNEKPLQSLSAASDGDLWVVEHTSTIRDGVKKEGYAINILSDGEVKSFEHDEITGSFIINLIVDDTHGRIYIHSTDSREKKDYVFVYDMDGRQLAKIDLEGIIQNIAFSGKENMLFMLKNENNSSTISVLNEDYTVDEQIKVNSTTSSSTLHNSGVYSLNVDLNSILMGFDYGAKTLTPIIDWVANGLAGNVRFVLPYGDGYVLIRREASNIDTVAKLSETSKPQGEKEKLTLATMKSDGLIELAVADFNKTSDSYYIEISDYSIYGEEALQKLSTEIISGKIPDIFNLDGLPMKQYSAAGLLEDLSPYMEKDLNMDKLWESAMSALSENGKIYTAVPGFAINAVAGTKESIAEIKNLEYDELLNYIETNTGTKQNVLGNQMTQTEFVEHVFLSNIDRFVDYEKKECSFDRDEFIALLDTAKNLVPYDENYTETLALYTGAQTLSFQWIWGISDVDSLAAVFRDNCAYVGSFGAGDDSGAAMMPIYSFGISAGSEYKDGAWQFLKWIYSDGFQQFMPICIPMNKDIFEMQREKFVNGLETQEGSDQEGFTYLNMVDGIEETTFIEYSKNRLGCWQTTVDLINSIDRLYQSDTVIMDIIREEVQAFLTGDRSAEETAGIIQSRVKLYINE